MKLDEYLASTGTTQTQLAVAIGVNQGVVSRWVHGQKRVSARRARQIELFTRGAVTAAELCPEVFGPVVELPGIPATAR